MVIQEIDVVQNRISAKVSDFRCSNCQKIIELPEDSIDRLRFDRKCAECEQQERMAAAEKQNADETARRASLIAQVPTMFQDTCRSLLPFPERLDQALGWTFGARGLLLMGDCGVGKSRVAWEVAKREIMAGKRFKAVSAFSLSRFPALFMAGDDAAGRFADELVSVDLLLLDDVFKAKATERVEELLFAVIDERGSWGKPCLITLNDTAETLGERLSIDRGPALIRRLKEYCQIIGF